MDEPVVIEVAYALPDRQWLVELQVPAGTTARGAVLQAAEAHSIPLEEPLSVPIGVFGKPVDDEHELKAGERVEIYRPLAHDPREQRRQLAAQGKTIGER